MDLWSSDFSHTNLSYLGWFCGLGQHEISDLFITTPNRKNILRFYLQRHFLSRDFYQNFKKIVTQNNDIYVLYTLSDSSKNYHCLLISINIITLIFVAREARFYNYFLSCALVTWGKTYQASSCKFWVKQFQ